MSACSFVLSLFFCVFLFILYGNFYYSQRFSFSAPRRGSLIPFYALSSWQGIPGLPDLGELFCLCFFFFLVSFSLSFFFSHLARDLKSRITVCTLGLPSWKDATGKVYPQVLQPRCPPLKQYQSLQLKLLLGTSGLDPVCFHASNIHNFITRWEEVLTGQEKRAEILSYLRDGVDVNSFFTPYKGDFQGKFCDSPIPPSACFPNSKSCEEFTDFISSTISQRLANGSISMWGKVGYAINRRSNETQALS